MTPNESKLGRALELELEDAFHRITSTAQRLDAWPTHLSNWFIDGAGLLPTLEQVGDPDAVASAQLAAQDSEQTPEIPGNVAMADRPTSVDCIPMDVDDDGSSEHWSDEDWDDADGISTSDEGRLVRYLQHLDWYIQLKQCSPGRRIPTRLKPNIELFDHQRCATRIIDALLSSDFRGCILADPPGLGKTLSAIAAILTRQQQGSGPAVIIAPASCCHQWMREIKTFCPEEQVKALLLTGDSIPPADLYDYDFVLASYTYVSAEFRRMNKFTEAIQLYKDHNTNRVPKRPHLALFSELFLVGTRGRDSVLVLDEAHMIKNTNRQTYAAISALRASFACCLMLTGTPLDNTWMDAFALISLLHGHPIHKRRDMTVAFTDAYTNENSRLPPPSGGYLKRLIQLLDAVTLRRPESIIGGSMPTVTRIKHTVYLSDDDLLWTNFYYERYRHGRAEEDQAASTSAPGSAQEDSSSKLGCLIKAQQAACHPRLMEMVRFEKRALLEAMDCEDTLDDVEEEKSQSAIDRWQKELSVDEAYSSPRVDKIVDIIRCHREIGPDDAIIVTDESVFFLHIVEIALRDQDKTLPIFRLDGRQTSAERHVTIEDFRAAKGRRVLLTSQGTGGVGLNLQCANVVIRPTPWWKRSTEVQTDARCIRPHQMRSVYIHEIEADNCDVEAYKKRVRDNKNDLNTRITTAITARDDEERTTRNII